MISLRTAASLLLALVAITVQAELPASVKKVVEERACNATKPVEGSPCTTESRTNLMTQLPECVLVCNGAASGGSTQSVFYITTSADGGTQRFVVNIALRGEGTTVIRIPSLALKEAIKRSHDVVSDYAQRNGLTTSAARSQLIGMLEEPKRSPLDSLDFNRSLLDRDLDRAPRNDLGDLELILDRPRRPGSDLEEPPPLRSRGPDEPPGAPPSLRRLGPD